MTLSLEAKLKSESICEFSTLLQTFTQNLWPLWLFYLLWFVRALDKCGLPLDLSSCSQGTGT